ncbi:hypothetical protein COT75_03580, partial [Candidatus Beckwithbacteria bacterium CG10_big_fil_rev_8_21_14_0_10_34_10]
TALGSLGPIALDDLRLLVKDEDLDVQREAATALGKIQVGKLDQQKKQEVIRNFIYSQEPLLANPLAKDLIDKDKPDFPLYPLFDVVNKLRNDYPSLIGLVVLGSLSKGYWIPGRDIDWGLVFKEGSSEKKTDLITNNFKKAVDSLGFRLCQNNSLPTSDNYMEVDPSKLEIVFNGLFFGNRKELGKVQKKILEKINQSKWREIQQVWEDSLNNYSKMAGRFGLGQEEIDLVINSRILLWSLPDLETMRQHQ